MQEILIHIYTQYRIRLTFKLFNNMSLNTPNQYYIWFQGYTLC